MTDPAELPDGYIFIAADEILGAVVKKVEGGVFTVCGDLQRKADSYRKWTIEERRYVSP